MMEHYKSHIVSYTYTSAIWLLEYIQKVCVLSCAVLCCGVVYSLEARVRATVRAGRQRFQKKWEAADVINPRVG